MIYVMLITVISSIIIVCYVIQTHNSTLSKLKSIEDKMDAVNDVLITISKHSCAVERVLDDIKNDTELIRKNTVLVSIINVGDYNSRANETIDRLVSSDRFEEADMLRKSLNGVIEMFTKNNPNIKIDIRDSRNLFKGDM